MSTTFKWSAAWTSQGNVLTTELNSLANAALTNAGTEVTNNTNLDLWGQVKLSVTFGTNPTAGGYINVYMITACDGTNYEDGSSSANPGIHKLVASIPVRAVTSAQVLTSRPFSLEPAKTKFIIENASGQAFPSSGSTLALFTADEGGV